MALESTSGNRLLELREAANLSRAALAAFVEVGEHQVRRWEAGEVVIPIRRLERLTGMFGVSVEHLMGWDRNHEKAAA